MKKNAKDTNIRLDAPLGRLGVPPDAFTDAGFTVLTDKVILIVDKPTALRFIGHGRGKGTPPS